jgi:hypothetical protein
MHPGSQVPRNWNAENAVALGVELPGCFVNRSDYFLEKAAVLG